ncbi:MAG: TonB family protein [Oligoflexia bacterium]|nr:TonB family protein [Oligoflexia bacterium]
MYKPKSALSWTFSVLIHAVLAFFVLRASYKYAFPEAAVESVSFEVATENVASQVADTPQAPTTTEIEPTKQEPEEPVAKVKPAPKPEPKVVAKPAPEKIVKPVFIPDKPQNIVQESEPEVETEQESPVEVAQEQPAQQAEEEPQPPIEQETQTTEMQDAQPEPAPEQIVQAIKEAQNLQQVQQPSTQQSNQQTQGQAQQIGQGNGSGLGSIDNEVRPAFGAPGSIIDETRLTERAGNRKPHYPWSARLKRQQGTAIIKAFVKPDGSVDSISLYKSSGVSALDKEALEAYAKWKYTPGAKGWVLKPFKFSLVGN